MTEYVVCDRCGHLWDIPWEVSDPVECPRCQHGAMWRFTDLENARVHAQTVKDLEAAR